MQQFLEFIDMGGYSGYVWPAFFVAAFVLAGMSVFTVRPLRKAQKALEKAHNRTES